MAVMAAILAVVMAAMVTVTMAQTTDCQRTVKELREFYTAQQVDPPSNWECCQAILEKPTECHCDIVDDAFLYSLISSPICLNGEVHC